MDENRNGHGSVTLMRSFADSLPGVSLLFTFAQSQMLLTFRPGRATYMSKFSEFLSLKDNKCMNCKTTIVIKNMLKCLL